jgi:hypothetical protein
VTWFYFLFVECQFVACALCMRSRIFFQYTDWPAARTLGKYLVGQVAMGQGHVAIRRP